jgi:hypothetical protein
MGSNEPDRFPDTIREVLANADRFELLSLEPAGGPTTEPGHFRGWRVLGSVVVTAKDRDALVSALERGIAENDGWVAACFIPRHGIRATHGGKVVDLVACFECAQCVYSEGEVSGSVLVTDSPQAMFDQVLSAAGVELAKPYPPEPFSAAAPA